MRLFQRLIYIQVSVSQLTEVSVVSSADEMMQLNFILGVFGLFVFADCAYVKKIHRGKLFLCVQMGL